MTSTIIIDESKTTDGRTYAVGKAETYVQTNANTITRSRDDIAYYVRGTDELDTRVTKLDVREGAVWGRIGIYVDGNGGNAEVKIGEDVEVRSDDAGIKGSVHGSVKIENRGEIRSTLIGVDLGYAGADYLNPDVLRFENHGAIEVDGQAGAHLYGFYSNADEVFLKNYGSIEVAGDRAASATAVLIYSHDNPANSAAFINYKNGYIYSPDVAIEVENLNAEVQVINLGTVEGDVIVQRLDNRGTIIGDVEITGDWAKNRGDIDGTIRLNDRFNGVTFDGRESKGDQDVRGGEFADTIRGGAYDDYLYGDDGNDRLYGGGGKDKLDGADGNDRLYVDVANSNTTLRGGEGDDRFIFLVDSGKHTIRDFENGRDRIDISAWSDIDDFYDLPADFVRKDGDDIVLELSTIGGSGRIRLEDFDSADLSASDFIL